MDTFAQHLGVKVIHVDASAEFMGKLAGVSDPEAKRKIIGKRIRRRLPARSGEDQECANGWRRERSIPT